MKISKEEQELIQKHREAKQKEEDENTPQLEGFAKHNIYLKEDLEEAFEANDSCDWLTSQSELDDYVRALRSFEPIIPKGTRFVCFVREGEQQWFDDIDYGLESMSEDWAEENLVNIRKIK